LLLLLLLLWIGVSGVKDDDEKAPAGVEGSECGWRCRLEPLKDLDLSRLFLCDRPDPDPADDPPWEPADEGKSEK